MRMSESQVKLILLSFNISKMPVVALWLHTDVTNVFFPAAETRLLEHIFI